MNTAYLKKFLTIALTFGLFALCIPQLSADENSSDNGDVIDMVTGDIQTITVNGLSRVSVTNPDVADIADAQGDKVSVLAKRAGSTVLFLWDAAGKRTVKIRVVAEDLSAVKDRVQKVLDEARITGVTLEINLDEGKVVLEGEMSKDDKNRLDDILQPYSDNLLNLVKLEKSQDLIEVDMQVLEISTTFEENLGVEWGGPSGLALNYNEQGVPFGEKFKDLFKVGNFERTTALQATLNAMVSEGKARVISKPRLVVVSGKQASFLVGGEIPIQNITTNTVGTTQTASTTYSQYGVNLSVTPTIMDSKIDVVLNVDIRDVDNSSDGLSSQGNVAFITRTASTDLYLDNRQTIVLAGLIKHEDSVNYQGIPILSKIPVLGALFRNKIVPGDTNTEMVIILTPVVLTDKKIADKQLVMPTPEERRANNEIDAHYEKEPLPTWPLPKITTPIPSNDPAVLAEMRAYARMVQIKISKSISYPLIARSSAGTVKLKLHILKDGSLDSEEVIDTSGSDILDQDAMNAAKLAAPYAAFSTGIDQEDMFFTIPIVYNKLVSQVNPAEKVIDSY